MVKKKMIIIFSQNVVLFFEFINIAMNNIINVLFFVDKKEYCLIYLLILIEGPQNRIIIIKLYNKVYFFIQLKSFKLY